MTEHKKNISKDELLDAAKRVKISSADAKSLWEALRKDHSIRAGFRVIHIFYFLGTLIACFALAWFMGSRSDLYGMRNLLIISLVYAIGFYATGLYFWKIKKKQLIGGLGIFIGISMVPLITYAIQSLTGWWPGQSPGIYSDFSQWMSNGWLAMELATILVLLITLHYIKFPILTILLYIALWFMAMDAAPLFSTLGPGDSHYHAQVWHIRTTICIILGLVLAINAFTLDRKHKEAFAFWGYLFGVTILWTGVTFIDNVNWFESAFYCIFNILLIIASPFLHRKVFLVYGIAGMMIYLYEIAYHRFANSVAFPFILSGIGLGIVVLSAVIQKNWSKIVHLIHKK